MRKKNLHSQRKFNFDNNEIDQTHDVKRKMYK